MFKYLNYFYTAYIDDIFIFFNNKAKHELHVKRVFQKLREAGLQVDIKKSKFNVKETTFLGFIVGVNKIRVDPIKFIAVREWKESQTVKKVQAFLGFCNFYRKFIRNFGRIAKSLNKLINKRAKWDFNKKCIEVFYFLKKILLSAPILQHYDFERNTRIEADVSDGVLKTVLL